MPESKSKPLKSLLSVSTENPTGAAGNVCTTGVVTFNVVDVDPAMCSAVAVTLIVIVVIPSVRSVTCPDEFTLATLGLLLEYDNTPALIVVIKLDKLKEVSVMGLFIILTTEITMGTKFGMLDAGLVTLVMGFPDSSFP